MNHAAQPGHCGYVTGKGYLHYTSSALSVWPKVKNSMLPQPLDQMQGHTTSSTDAVNLFRAGPNKKKVDVEYNIHALFTSNQYKKQDSFCVFLPSYCPNS